MADAFNQAVSALLQHGDPRSRQQANTWLEQWQQTPEAWTVAADVLQNNHSIDAQYFAAQTLRTKVPLLETAVACCTHRSITAMISRTSAVLQLSLTRERCQLDSGIFAGPAGL